MEDQVAALKPRVNKTSHHAHEKKKKKKRKGHHNPQITILYLHVPTTLQHKFLLVIYCNVKMIFR